MNTVVYSEQHLFYSRLDDKDPIITQYKTNEEAIFSNRVGFISCLCLIILLVTAIGLLYFNSKIDDLQEAQNKLRADRVSHIRKALCPNEKDEERVQIYSPKGRSVMQLSDWQGEGLSLEELRKIELVLKKSENTLFKMKPKSQLREFQDRVVLFVDMNHAKEIVIKADPAAIQQ